ncbi:MAG: DNA translocase FtsK 4TM domain-containing protein [Hahellaceae bacterium]|nr:DNA translocase FtsK 4TM domain-containing protein [Hahellaceae bacterium]
MKGTKESDSHSRYQLIASQGMREGSLIAMIAVCIYLMMALVSFDASDPGWASTGHSGKVVNFGGRTGAWLASILYYFLGHVAFLFPVMAAYRCWKMFRRRLSPKHPFHWPLFILRTTGFVVILVSATGLLALYSIAGLPDTAGGVLGKEIVRLLLPAFNLSGTTLVLVSLFLFGVTVFTGFSWLRLIDRIGFGTLALIKTLLQGSLWLWLKMRRIPREIHVDATSGEGLHNSESKYPETGIPEALFDAEQVKSDFGQNSAEDITKLSPEIKPSLWRRMFSKRKANPVVVAEEDDSQPFELPLYHHSDEGESQEFRRVEPVIRVDEFFESEFVENEPVVHSSINTEATLSVEKMSTATVEHIQPPKVALRDQRSFDSNPEVDLEVLPVLSVSPEDRPQASRPDPAPEVYATREPSVLDSPQMVSVSPAADTPAVNAPKAVKIEPLTQKQLPNDPLANVVEKQAGLFDFVDGPLPPITLLDPPDKSKKTGYSKEALEYLSRLLEEKLADFGISAEVVEVNPGPVITRFEIQPAPGVKVSRISNLVKDLARSLAVLSVRVVEVIPGKSVVGIEIPNEEREIVRFSEVLGSKEYEECDSPIALALGNDIAGNPVVVNLAKMPHLLVAGTTGSGKSVGVNAMLLSMLFKATPEEVRLIMVDPKMLELSIYDGIPHLLTPVVTDMKDAANALRWSVAEMERRYRLMASMGVRNIAGFNRKVKDAEERGEPIRDPLWVPHEALNNTEADRPFLGTLPFIVVVVDEFADMMMIVGKKVEELIARIAQKARAAGIHLILATQRPSVDVITGLIKANVPTRISFQVSSKIDSRTILDQGGAEQLLGHGDMLYLPPGSGNPVRVHGAFVSDDEVHRVVSDWKRRGEPDYLDEILTGGDTVDPYMAAMGDGGSGDSEQDALYDEAVAFVTETRRASISAVQRKLKIGYNRAANLVEAMEAAGVVSSPGHNGNREVIAPSPPR